MTLERVKWCLTVVLIHISLMANDTEQFFKCFMAICMCSLEKCLFRSLAYFKIRLFVFYYCDIKVLSIFWVCLLSDVCFAIIFSHSVDYLSFS